jgi:chromosome partitioning protein
MPEKTIKPIDSNLENIVESFFKSSRIEMFNMWKKPDDLSPKVIALFNHKGGVSKTTTTFNLGWMLANKGLKVLIVDADPQCNLTGLALGIDDYDDLFDFYNKKNNSNIYDSLAGEFGFTQTTVNLASGIDVTDTKNDNLKILAGHINFSKFDLQIATALTSSSSIPLLKPLIGAVNTLIRKTAEKGSFDVVLIDMSPSVSAINMCMFMSCDYFLLPTSPDFYCYQAIDSLSEVLPEWADKLSSFKDGISLPRNNPKMLGVISQNYRVYSRKDDSDEMTQEFKKWSDKIRDITKTKLVPLLQKKNMVIAEKDFKKFVDYDSPYNIASIQNFNSLIPVSQTKSKPFFELVQSDSNWAGAVWSRMDNGREVGAAQNIKKSKEIYSKLSDSILGIIGFEKV